MEKTSFIFVDLNGERPDKVGETVREMGEDQLVIGVGTDADGQATSLEKTRKIFVI